MPPRQRVEPSKPATAAVNERLSADTLPYSCAASVRRTAGGGRRPRPVLAPARALGRCAAWLTSPRARRGRCRASRPRGRAGYSRGRIPAQVPHREGISVGSAPSAPERNQVRPKGAYELVKRGVGLCLCSSRRLAQHSTRRLLSAGSLALPATGRPSRACRASSREGQRAMRRRDRWHRRWPW